MSGVAKDVFERVMRRGTKLSRRGFTLYYLKLLHPPAPRIVISQKVDKRATVRNRLRRQIRAILAKSAPANRAVIIIVRKELLGMSFVGLKTELERAISQIE